LNVGGHLIVGVIGLDANVETQKVYANEHGPADCAYIKKTLNLAGFYLLRVLS
jgi:hypothetical protein